MPTNGRAASETSNFNPTSDTSHPVLVVPRFAPMITAIALGNAINPALTKPIVITVVALED
jgi:hypothetical protein